MLIRATREGGGRAGDKWSLPAPKGSHWPCVPWLVFFNGNLFSLDIFALKSGWPSLQPPFLQMFTSLNIWDANKFGSMGHFQSKLWPVATLRAPAAASRREPGRGVSVARVPHPELARRDIARPSGTVPGPPLDAPHAG